MVTEQKFLKKKILWLLPFYMVVATSFYYEKVHTTMPTAIVSNLLKRNCRVNVGHIC